MGDVIAIDGPAGAGKSTVARLLAERLGYDMFDTGATYRAVALLAREAGVNLEDDARLAAFAAELPLEVAFVDGVTRIRASARDISPAELRTPEVSRLVSFAASCEGVRAVLVKLQRAVGSRRNIVCEGRDITTVVFPDARVKIYLTASLEERAKRRRGEHLGRGERVSLEDARSNIAGRDEKDGSRRMGPLCIADDAEVVDTTAMDTDEVVETLFRIAARRS